MSDYAAAQRGAGPGSSTVVEAAAALPVPETTAPDRGRSQVSLDAAAPSSRLAAAIDSYRSIAASGGWSPVSPGEILKLGSTGPGVVALRDRLRITEDLPEDSQGSEQFDAELANAVRAFQARHGLNQDAIVGPKTLEAINIPVERRLAAMMLNLGRLARQEPEWGSRYIVVNAAAATYRYVDHGAVVLEGPAVVGRPDWQTPELDSAIDWLELNPYWTVPPRIAARELWPKIHRDPAYLERNHMQIVNGLIRQDPGQGNPLGNVKFLFTNPYNVYLHDTDHPELFGNAQRFRSHGCVRVFGALDLARALLRDDPFWTEIQIHDAINQAGNIRVRLESPIPLHIVYNTAWVDEAGMVQFREDVYGRDRKADAEPLPRMMNRDGD
jgi:murein L,D-transpeptidase YcbB/YkuD